MEPVSGMISGAVCPPSTAACGKAKPQRPEDNTQGSPTAPARDEYIPEEKQEPSGLYWLGRDGGGRLKVYFDDPDRTAADHEKQDELPAEELNQDGRADGPEKDASGGKAESCTCNTDKVDREVEKLKKKREELERQIRSVTDGARIRELEQELAQVEGELRRKDNDSYRRQHAAYSSAEVMSM